MEGVGDWHGEYHDALAFATHEIAWHREYVA